MLVAVSFRAKPGKTQELHGLLADPDAGRYAARAMGATRNTLFLHDDGRMIRVLEFPDDAAPVPMFELAQKDGRMHDFLQSVGRLAQDGFDIDDRASLQAFNERNSFRLAFDVKV